MWRYSALYSAVRLLTSAFFTLYFVRRQAAIRRYVPVQWHRHFDPWRLGQYVASKRRHTDWRSFISWKNRNLSVSRAYLHNNRIAKRVSEVWRLFGQNFRNLLVLRNPTVKLGEKYYATSCIAFVRYTQKVMLINMSLCEMSLHASVCLMYLEFPVCKNKEGTYPHHRFLTLQFGGLNYFLVCDADVDSLSANINIVKKKVKASLQSSYEIHLEMYIDKTKCVSTYTKKICNEVIVHN